MTFRVTGSRLLAVAVAAMAAATAACSDDQSPAGQGEFAEGFDFVISYALERAESVGASPEQMAILEEAQQQGEVSLDLYNEAIDNALRCLRELGYDPHDGGITEDRGFPERAYTVPVEAEAADAVEFAPGATVHRCIAEHSLAVEGAYQNQPASVEAQEAHDRAMFEPHRDAIVTCAKREGINVDPDGDILEIVKAVWAAYDLEQTEVDCTEGTWGQ